MYISPYSIDFGSAMRRIGLVFVFSYICLYIPSHLALSTWYRNAHLSFSNLWKVTNSSVVTSRWWLEERSSLVTCSTTSPLCGLYLLHWGCWYVFNRLCFHFIGYRQKRFVDICVMRRLLKLPVHKITSEKEHVHFWIKVYFAFSLIHIYFWQFAYFEHLKSN